MKKLVGYEPHLFVWCVCVCNACIICIYAYYMHSHIYMGILLYIEVTYIVPIYTVKWWWTGKYSSHLTTDLW